MQIVEESGAALTEELNHPFAPRPNGVPLNDIWLTAEISLAPHLNEHPSPPILPTDHYRD